MTHKVSNITEDALMMVGGTVVGAGLALLFAPQTGAKCRKEMVRFGKTVSKKSDKAFRHFTDSVSDFADAIGGKSGGIFHRW